MSSVEQLRRIATPACWAMNVSRQENAAAVAWNPAKHLLTVDRLLVDAVRGKAGKVIVIEAPPRHGKSEFISGYFPSWFIGRHPDKRVILTSYGDSLASTYGRRCRDLLHHYGSWFGLNGIRSDVKGASDWLVAGRTGGMRTAGVGGPITGRGADLLIIDDPVKNAEEAISQTVRDAQWDWFLSTAWTRLEPGGICVVMMTRWHDDDLIGRLLKLAESPNMAEMPDFSLTRLTLPALAEPTDAKPDPLGRQRGEALWPEQWPASYLEMQRQFLGDYWYNALFQQRPGQYGRAEWPDDYFAEPFWVNSLPDGFDWSVIAVDPSKGRDTGDFSGVVWVGFARGLLWVDARVERLAAPALCRKIVEVYRKRGGYRVGVEANHFQDLLAAPIEAAAREAKVPPLPISLITNTVNKQLRIGRLGPYLDRHAFRFLDTPGNRELVRQLKAFPLGEYDDGPDALEMAVRLLEHVIRSSLDDANS